MEQENIKKVIQEVASSNQIKIDINNLDTNLKTIGIDSLKMMDLIFKIESKLNVRIPDEELIKIKTLRELISILENLVK